MVLVGEISFGRWASAPSFFQLHQVHLIDFQNEQKLDVLHVCARVNGMMAYLRMWSISDSYASSSPDEPQRLTWRLPMSAEQSSRPAASARGYTTTPDVRTTAALDPREILVREVCIAAATVEQWQFHCIGR